VTLETVRSALIEAPIVPVVTVDDSNRIGPLCDALASGGIRVVEITLRTPAGLAGIQAAAAAGGIVVAAGTVTSREQVDLCVRAGATVVISPGFDLGVVLRAHELGVVAIPGIATATEALRAIDAGSTLLKLFPAEQLGGVHMIEALSAPLPGVSFLASGGINAQNCVEYLRHPAVAGVAGSWMCPRIAVTGGDFTTIQSLAIAATQLAARVRQ
jgi:2-dehydro-3-deoxyphosphogluconate aldolase/(4S)-4-hydroxy-2-oxoglutarate aldolase